MYLIQGLVRPASAMGGVFTSGAAITAVRYYSDQSDTRKRLYEQCADFMKDRGLTAKTILNSQSESKIHFDLPGPTTVNFEIWSSLAPTDQFNSQGKLWVRNKDKEELCVQLVDLIDSRKVDMSDRVVLVCEGCDNADYLGLLLPHLIQSNPRRDVKVLLINGNKKKLTHTFRFASAFVGPSNVSCHVDDALYRPSLPQLERYANYQRVFLPFRLLIVDQYSVIHRYLRARTSMLESDDIVLGCFRKWNKTFSGDDVWVAREEYSKSTNEELGYANYSRRALRGARERFLARVERNQGQASGLEGLQRLSLAELLHLELQEGIASDIISQYHMSITPRAGKNLLQNLGAEILFFGQVNDHSDHPYPISLLPTVWMRR